MPGLSFLYRLPDRDSVYAPPISQFPPNYDTKSAFQPAGYLKAGLQTAYCCGIPEKEEIHSWHWKKNENVFVVIL